MKRTITITTCLAALFAAGIVSADTVSNTVWIRGPNSRDNYTEWRSIDSVLECSYGPWTMATQADGARLITRTKQCLGNETLNLGVLPQ